jgi:hypothetical protein
MSLISDAISKNIHGTKLMLSSPIGSNFDENLMEAHQNLIQFKKQTFLSFLTNKNDYDIV